MNLSVNSIIAVIVFLGAIPLWMNILKSLEVEAKFKKGSIKEIKLFYILTTIILCFLTQESVMFLINIWK